MRAARQSGNLLDSEKPDQGSLAGDIFHRKGIILQIALFQRGADRAEISAEGAADALNSGNDRNGDTGGNQTVFDGGRPRLIGQKPRKMKLQLSLLGV
jgi:hypothetical protein